MPDQDNPAGNHEDPHQGDANAHQDGIPNGIQRLPNNADPEHGQDAPNAHPKQSVLIRLWHSLWRKRIFWHQRPDRPHVNWAEITIVCLTIGIVIAAFIQAFIYWKQAGIMERSLEQNQQGIALNTGQVAIARRNATTAENTLAEMKNGGEDTHRLAIEAKNQSDINRESLQSVQRAFILPSTIDIQISGTKGAQSTRLFVHWDNSGVTPGRGTSRVNYKWDVQPLPEDFAFPDLREEGAQHVVTPFILGPKGNNGIIIGPIPPDVFKGVISRYFRLYVYGWARYRDVFKGTPEHLTEFCNELVPLDPPNFSQAQDIDFTAVRFRVDACPKHNCYDKDCSDYADRTKRPP